jgi:hypothetical protein
LYGFGASAGLRKVASLLMPDAFKHSQWLRVHPEQTLHRGSMTEGAIEMRKWLQVAGWTPKNFMGKKDG